MGVDTRAVSMIGMWFEDMKSCVDYLQRHKIITKQQAEELNEGGFDGSDFPLEYHDISCYSEEGGYLGLQVPCSINVADLEVVIAKVQNVLGDDVGYHNFVYWY